MRTIAESLLSLAADAVQPASRHNDLAAARSASIRPVCSDSNSSPGSESADFEEL